MKYSFWGAFREKSWLGTCWGVIRKGFKEVFGETPKGVYSKVCDKVCGRACSKIFRFRGIYWKVCRKVCSGIYSGAYNKLYSRACNGVFGSRGVHRETFGEICNRIFSKACGRVFQSEGVCKGAFGEVCNRIYDRACGGISGSGAAFGGVFKRACNRVFWSGGAFEEVSRRAWFCIVITINLITLLAHVFKFGNWSWHIRRNFLHIGSIVVIYMTALTNSYLHKGGNFRSARWLVGHVLTAKPSKALSHSRAFSTKVYGFCIRFDYNLSRFAQSLNLVYLTNFSYYILIQAVIL